jgi:hypothetical protein
LGTKPSTIAAIGFSLPKDAAKSTVVDAPSEPSTTTTLGHYSADNSPTSVALQNDPVFEELFPTPIPADKVILNRRIKLTTVSFTRLTISETYV